MLQVVGREQVEGRRRHRDQQPLRREQAEAARRQDEHREDPELGRPESLVDRRQRVPHHELERVRERVAPHAREPRAELALRGVPEGGEHDEDREGRPRRTGDGEARAEPPSSRPGEHQPERGIREPHVLLHRERDCRGDEEPDDPFPREQDAAADEQHRHQGLRMEVVQRRPQHDRRRTPEKCRHGCDPPDRAVPAGEKVEEWRRRRKGEGLDDEQPRRADARRSERREKRDPGLDVVTEERPEVDRVEGLLQVSEQPDVLREDAVVEVRGERLVAQERESADDERVEAGDSEDDPADDVGDLRRRHGRRRGSPARVVDGRGRHGVLKSASRHRPAARRASASRCRGDGPPAPPSR